MRRTFSTLAVTLLVAAALTAPQAAAAPPDQVDVIVVLKAGNATSVAADHGVDLAFVYSHALNGFAGSVPEGRINGLRHDPRVDYLEYDQVVTVAEQVTPTGVQRIFASGNAAIDIDATDDLRVDVDVAVIDTGIDFEHPDLNVVGGVSCWYSNTKGPAWAKTYTCGAGGDDDHYHGTHVAGTVGALDNGLGVVGVAPGARLWAVKVLNAQGSGYASNVIAGIDWVAANAATIEVANMSLGGGFSQAENDAVANAVAAGVVFVVAAGNSSTNAANSSPASEPSAITVSALADFDGLAGGFGSPTCRSDQDDTLADFSNYGTIVDMVAPGVCITSTYPIERGTYGTISGTSMASPHVAGAAALLASAGASATQVTTSLLANGNFGWIDQAPDEEKEPLLDVTGFTPTLVDGPGGGGSEPPPDPDPEPDPDPDPTGGTASVASETYSQFGGRNGDNNLDVTIGVVDSDGVGIAGLTVTIDLFNGTSSTATGVSGVTDSAGNVTFGFRKTGPGCFSADVTDVSGAGWTWDYSDPETTSCP